MDKKLPHAVFLDIDGTLMEHGPYNNLRGGEIPAGNVEAITRARQAGHKVIINTGRGFFCLPDCVHTQCAFDGFVTGLGAHVSLDGKTVHNNPIKNSDIPELISFMEKNKKACRFQTSVGAFVYDNNNVQEYSDFWHRIMSAEELIGLVSDGFIEKITIDYGLKGIFLDFLRSGFNVVCYGDAGEVTAAGNSKADGMCIALSALGIPLERSIAMGDSLNDVDVLQRAGISVATDNADPAVKEMCDMVTLRDVDGGVGYAIEKLLL